MDEKMSEYLITALESLRSIYENPNESGKLRVEAAHDALATVMNITQMKQMFERQGRYEN